MVQRYLQWAPVVARILFGVFFLQAAVFKIPGATAFAASVAYSADKLPFPALAVTLACILEVITGLALLLGWHTRLAAAVLVPYIALLTVLFHLSFASQVDYGFFIDHLLLIAGLLYVSAHGAQRLALRKDVVIDVAA